MRLCLSRPAAVGACCALCASYVGVLYVGYDTARSRDEPAIIRQRFARVLGMCAASPLALALFAAPAGAPVGACAREIDAPISAWLGLALDRTCLLASAGALALTCLLFLGPLFVMDADDWRCVADERFSPTLVNARALLVGPLAEEVVFRAVMCPLLFAAGLSPASSVLVGSVVFGAAHVHHRVDMRRSWLAVLVMFTYTALFGGYSAYLFMRTGRLLPPFVAHAFCNLMGLPDFGAVARHARPRLAGAAFVLGLLGFGALVAADAAWRPHLFGSILWDERESRIPS